MFRRHFFLVIAVVLIVAMGVAAGFKLMSGPKGAGGAGAPGGQQAAGGARPGGAPGAGGAAGGRPGGGRGRGGPTLVGAVPVTQRPFTDRVEVLGVAKGRESVTLTSNQAEMVTAVRFKPGQRVSKGQVLLDLKADEEDAQIMQAQATVGQAKADVDRWQTLLDRGFAPKATVDQYKSAYATAQANLRAAQARRSDRVIRAPFSGTVGLSDIAPGALISPGTAIATLDDTSVIHVDFDVPDRFLPIIREGMPIQARPDAYPDLVQGGVIARIDTRIDERTRAVKARAEFKNAAGKLKPGMLMRVGIERGNRMSLTVPESAIQFSGDSSYVYVINPSAPASGQPGQPGQGGQPPAAARGQGAPGPMAEGSPGAAGRGPGGAAGGPRVAAPPCSALLNAADSRIAPAAKADSAKATSAPAPATNAPTGPGGAPGAAGRAGRGGGGRPGQAEQRPVLAGLIEGGYVEIKDGLKPGEIIVSDGLNKLQPGQPVMYCAAQLPSAGAAGGPGRGAGGAPGAPGQGRQGRAGGPMAMPPGAEGRPGGQFGGAGRQGRPGAPGGRVAGAAS